MFAARIVQGRRIGREEVELIGRLVSAHPNWSRRRLSIAFCEQLGWRSPAGQLKDMSARLLLTKLAEQGLVTLPPRRPGGGRKKLRALAGPELFDRLAPEPITAALKELRPLDIILCEPRRVHAESFIRHLARFHYLGWGGNAGANLRYLVRDRQGRDLACVLFAGAAWKVKARDAFIGWSHTQRESRLGLVVNNSRFLILPHVRVPHLASHILGLILRRLPSDWQRKYAMTPCLAESFVERERFAGVCYRAANWILAGQSRGRSRADREHTLQVPIKDIYLYPLVADFRQQLCT